MLLGSTNITVYDGNITYSLTEAVSSGLVTGIYYYDGGYKNILGEDCMFKPGYAYWLYSTKQNLKISLYE